ncbi:MAG: hypothetical protein M0Q49_07390 [Porticoccaceae bacterium]|nr:hypothetical protein [Porticoccaceae bacterium]
MIRLFAKQVALLLGGCITATALAGSEREAEAREVVSALYSAVVSADANTSAQLFPERYFFVAADQMSVQEQERAGQEMLAYLRGLYPPDTVCEPPLSDPDNPEFRGMITILHQCQDREPIRFEMRADTGQQGGPLRIMRLRVANNETFPEGH